MEERHTVMLANHSQLMMAGIKAMVESSALFQVVAQTEGMDELTRRAGGLKPEMILIHMSLLPSMQTPDHPVAQLKKVSPKSTILILTDDGDNIAAIRQAIQAGASGVVAGNLDQQGFLQAMSKALSQSVYIPPEKAVRLLKQPQMDQIPLSDREQQILAGIAYGHTNREIAERLFLSIRTVEAHRAAIQNKLDLHSRAQLVGYAIQHHLLEAAPNWLEEAHAHGT